MTFKLSMIVIQSNTKLSFVGEHTTYLTLTERVNTFFMISPKEKSHRIRRAVQFKCGVCHFEVLHCQIFSLAINSKTVKVSTGKIQLNAELNF